MTNFLEIVHNKNDSIQENNFDTWFWWLNKINKIKNMWFPYFEKKQVQEWLDDLPDNRVITREEYNKYLPHIKQQNMLVKHSDTIFGYIVGTIDKDRFSLSQINNSIADTKKQDWLFIKQLSIVNTPVEEYNEIPPAHIIMLEKKARELNIFDKISVLEPKEQIITETMIKDPVLVWTINEYKDLFFIIWVWNDNIDLQKYLTQWTEALIDESKKFLNEFKQVWSLGFWLLQNIKSLN